MLGLSVLILVSSRVPPCIMHRDNLPFRANLLLHSPSLSSVLLPPLSLHCAHGGKPICRAALLLPQSPFWGLLYSLSIVYAFLPLSPFWGHHCIVRMEIASFPRFPLSMLTFNTPHSTIFANLFQRWPVLRAWHLCGPSAVSPEICQANLFQRWPVLGAGHLCEPSTVSTEISTWNACSHWDFSTVLATVFRRWPILGAGHLCGSSAVSMEISTCWHQTLLILWFLQLYSKDDQSSRQGASVAPL